MRNNTDKNVRLQVANKCLFHDSGYRNEVKSPQWFRIGARGITVGYVEILGQLHEVFAVGFTAQCGESITSLALVHFRNMLTWDEPSVKYLSRDDLKTSPVQMEEGLGSVYECDYDDLATRILVKWADGTGSPEGGTSDDMRKTAAMEVVMEVENLCSIHEKSFQDVSFTLRKGEILGFGGLVGAGRTELMHLLYGAAKKTSGHIYLGDKEMNFHSPSDALKAGIGLIPEDRKYQGCFLEKPLYWNISISNIDTLSHGSFVDTKAEMAQAEEYKGKMRIKAPNMKQLALSLSGGNQQKVVIAKAMAGLPDILIFDEPTRGIDVGARHEIYQMMIDLTEQGKSILMVSSDMEELLGMSERIVVLYDGHQAGILSKDEFSQETILTLASGL